jgi:hypothetical protein
VGQEGGDDFLADAVPDAFIETHLAMQKFEKCRAFQAAPWACQAATNALLDIGDLSPPRFSLLVGHLSELGRRPHNGTESRETPRPCVLRH